MAKLGANITSSQTRIPLFDYINSAEIPSSGVVLIETEEIKYTNTTDFELIDCVRGYNGTTTASHAQDTAVTLSSSESIDARFSSGVSVLEGTGAPIDGTNGTGTSYAESGSLYIDRTSGTHYTNTGTKTSPVWASTGGGSATPGGNDTEIQFNDSGAFAGDSNLTWDGTYLTLDESNAGLKTSEVTNDGGLLILRGDGNNTKIDMESAAVTGDVTRIFITANTSEFDGKLNVYGTLGVNLTAYDTLNPAAVVQIDSTTQGFLPPRMTTTQRDAISSPPAGLMIYNTTTDKLNVFTTAWEVITSA